MLSKRAQAALADRNPPATEQAIKDLEDAAGVTLPKDYREFLKESDGAGALMVEAEGEIFPDGWLSRVTKILPDSMGYELPERILMIGTDGGGGAYCYNFRFDPPFLMKVDLEISKQGRQKAYYGTSFDGFLCHLANDTTEPKPKEKRKKAVPPTPVDESKSIIKVKPGVWSGLSGFPYCRLAAIALSPDQRYLLASNHIYDMAQGKASKLPCWASVHFFIDGGARHVGVDWAPTVAVVDTASGAEMGRCTLDVGVKDVRICDAAISGDERCLAIVDYYGHGVTLFDVRAMRQVGQVKPGAANDVMAVALSHDGQVLATAHDEGTSSETFLSLFDTATQQRITKRLFPGRITSLRFFADGRLLMGNFENGIAILDPAGNERLKIPDPTRALLNCVLAGANEDRIVFTTQTGVIQVHDLNGKLLKRLRGPKGTTDVATVSRDGTMLVTGKEKHAKLRVWDLTV